MEEQAGQNIQVNILIHFFRKTIHGWEQAHCFLIPRWEVINRQEQLRWKEMKFNQMIAYLKHQVNQARASEIHWQAKLECLKRKQALEREEQELIRRKEQLAVESELAAAARAAAIQQFDDQPVPKQESAPPEFSHTAHESKAVKSEHAQEQPGNRSTSQHNDNVNWMELQRQQNQLTHLLLECHMKSALPQRSMQIFNGNPLLYHTFANGTMLPNCEHPVYLGVTLDRTLTYKHHIEALRCKVNVRNGLLRCLAGSTWGAYTSTLRTGALALVYSAAEYASPVWSRSAHTGKLDVGLYDSMRIITGCMRPTETTFLPVLAGIVPPDIRRESQVARLTKMAMDNPSHLLHDRVSVAVTYANEHEQRLKSRRPFSRHAAHLVANNYDPPKAWNDRIDAGPPFIRSACPPPSPSLPPGADLPRKQWVRLNRLRSGTARVGETLQLWGMQEAASCPCGHPTQTVEHVVTDCVLLKSPGDLTALCCPNAETRSWLSELPIELWTLIFDYLVVVWQTLIYIPLQKVLNR